MKQYLSKPQQDESFSDERRSRTRELVSGWSATVFLENGINISAEIKDGSAGGAGLLFTGQAGLIVKDAIVTIYIKAHHRHFTRRLTFAGCRHEGNDGPLWRGIYRSRWP